MSYRLSLLLGAASMALASGTPASGAGGVAPSVLSNTQSGPSAIRLVPTISPDHDPKDPKHLSPSDKHTLHYTGANSPDSAYSNTHAAVDFDFHHPALPLEFIDTVTDIQCPSDNEIHFSFGGNANLFDQAVNHDWPKSGTPFILIDNTDGCGNDQERTFFQVESYTSDKKKTSVIAKGIARTGADSDITKGFKANWGHSVSPSASSSAKGPTPTKAPSLMERAKRGWWGDITSEAGSVVGDVTSKAGSVGGDITSAAGDVTSAAGGVASQVTSAGGAVESWGKDHIPNHAVSTAVSTNVDISPTGTASSPWGPAKSVGTLDGVTIYCVECGAHGNLGFDGSITVQLDDPIVKEGAVDISAQDFSIPMVFGFEAKDAKSPTLPIQFQIFSEGIVPFEIPNIFTIGPLITVGIDFQVAVSATGNLKAGVEYKWDNAQAHMDLTNKDTSASKNSGWDPSVKRVFNMTDGHVDVNGTLGVPISLSFGINVLDGKFNQNVSITDMPAIELDTIVQTHGNQKRYEDRNHARDLLIRAEDQGQCLNGIQEIISLENSVELNVFDIWNSKLATFSTQVYSTCINTASGSGPSVATSSSGPSGVAAPTGGVAATPTASTGTESPPSAANTPSSPNAPTPTPTA